MRRIGTEAVWIGNAREARDPGGLHEAGIVAVIDLAMEETPVALPREFLVLRLPLVDSQEVDKSVLRLAIQTAANLITARIPTLVACHAGLSRSPCVVAGAISLVRCFDPVLALQQVRLAGPADVSPGLWQAVEDLLQHRHLI